MYIREHGLKRSSHLFSSTQLRNGDVRFFCGSNDKSKLVWVALCSFLLENFFHSFFLLKYGFFRLNHWLSTLLCKSKLLYLPIFLQLVSQLSLTTRSFPEPKGQDASTILLPGSKENNSFHFPREGRSATFESDGTLQYQGRHGFSVSSLSNMTKSSFMVASAL